MRWFVLPLVVFLFCGCEVNVQDKPPDVNVVKPADVNVTTPKVEVEVNRKE
jgi:hypothetical protein